MERSYDQGEEFDSESLSNIIQRKQKLMENHGKYLDAHPELNEVLNDFTSSVLLHKPDDIFAYARKYFAPFHQNPVLNKPLVFAGPSGVGKGTILGMLMKEYPDTFCTSISYTTRKQRPTEKNGVHYHFITKETFKKMVEQDKFLEFAEVHDNMYGTAKEEIQRITDLGKICVLEIDIQGAMNVYNSRIDANYIFLDPPSMDVLEDRLRSRGTDNEASIKLRCKNAADEITASRKCGLFPYRIVNQDIDATYNALLELLRNHYDHLMIRITLPEGAERVEKEEESTKLEGADSTNVVGETAA
mmetsp:Transcript_31753/g.36099  ORF Transcript_31753/g.36099 Transcript_31753/m.36099 type:complete len:302 (-) Transcript_31753:414-1319(-)